MTNATPPKNPQQPSSMPMGASPMHSDHWLNVTLYSIGGAVIATDTQVRVTFMNPVVGVTKLAGGGF